MMTRKIYGVITRLLLLVLLSLMLKPGAFAQVSSDSSTKPVSDASLTSKVDKLFAPWDKPDSPGAALMVFKDGVVIYKRGYGLANLEYSIPITPATVFHVASVSKQFTAFAI